MPLGKRKYSSSCFIRRLRTGQSCVAATMDNGKHLIQNRGDDKQKAFYHFSQEYIAVHKENKKKKHGKFGDSGSPTS